MVTKSQRIRLGIFISCALLVLILTIAVIVAPKILEERDMYFIGFRDISVTGLVEGGPVKYHGLTVGYVSDIRIDPKDIRRVIVEVSLEHDTPIKDDTKAEITLLGITGIKIIELRGGSNEAMALKPGSFVTPGISMTDRITGSAEIIAEKAELVMNNLAMLTDDANRQKLVLMTDNLNKTLVQFYDLLHDNRSTIQNTLNNTEQITSETKEMATMARETMANINQTATVDTLHRIIGNLVEITESLKKADLVRLIQELNITLEQTNKMLRDVESTFIKSRGDVLETIESVKETADYLNQFTRLLSEDPSVIVRGTKPKDAPDFNLEK